MKLTHLVDLIIVIFWIVYAEAQIYYVDVISIPSNSQQVSGRQQRQQQPLQRVSFQQQPQQRTVQSQSQKSRTRPIRQPQTQGTTVVQQVVLQKQQQQPTSQRRQQNKVVRQSQTQQQQQSKTQRQQQTQNQQVQRQQPTQQQQTQRQQQAQQQQTHRQQTQQQQTQRQQQAQQQQTHRQQTQQQQTQRQQQAQQQQTHRQQQSNTKQQPQAFKQQSHRQQQSQSQGQQSQRQKIQQQQQQRPITQDIVITFPSNTQQSQQQWSQQQSVPVTFPGVTSRPSLSTVNQNTVFVKPNNPFLTGAASQSNQQNLHFGTNDKISSPVSIPSQFSATAATDSFNNGFNNNFDPGSLVQSNGFTNTVSSNVGNGVPFSANGFDSFNNVAISSSSSTNNFGGSVDTLNNPFSSNFAPGNSVQNNGFNVAPSTNVGSVTSFGGNNFDNGASSNSPVLGVGFNNGVSNNAFSTATATSVDNGFNDFDRVPVINTVNNFNSNTNGFRDRGENFDYNRWFSPHRPQSNHYRDFAGIFNSIDQKAESDYNTSTEDDEMNDDFNGRSVVSPGQYPHMAALGYRSALGGTKFKCGGSLISELYVLTAAHCCFLNGQAPHLVRIGDVKLKKFEHNDIPQRRGIARVIKHPYYNDSMYYNDIGLLELANPIVYTYYVRPIRLWASDDIPYDKVFTMGYGSTDFAQAPTNVLTELDLSIVPLNTCNRTMPPDPNAPYGITESQICAKDYEKNRDTCQGDSGGPLQLNLERPRSRRLRYYLVGIISYGTFCRSRYPGIYTRVSSYIDWIASEVWPEYFNNFQ